MARPATASRRGGGEAEEEEHGANGAGLPEEGGVNGVTEQLRQTALSAQDADHDDTAAAPAAGGAKKRNRQKERMARRAAEQVAAAEAAESEAANMTDHRGLEKRDMEKTFAAHGLVEKDIRPDGHCLFSAVADQLEQHSIPLGTVAAAAQPFRTVRAAAAEYMTAHADDFAPFLEEPLAAHVAKIRDTAEWGGQLELLALANAYSVEIRVVQDGRTEVIAPTSAEQPQETVWLAYYRHGYGLGEHYNSLRRKEKQRAS